ncbi:MAG: hypothetical protein IMW91_08890 [Firmicutes bacterium]|nr:hypothetical protein [Bacillota bacterium]
MDGGSSTPDPAIWRGVQQRLFQQIRQTDRDARSFMRETDEIHLHELLASLSDFKEMVDELQPFWKVEELRGELKRIHHLLHVLERLETVWQTRQALVALAHTEEDGFRAVLEQIVTELRPVCDASAKRAVRAAGRLVERNWQKKMARAIEALPGRKRVQPAKHPKMDAQWVAQRCQVRQQAYQWALSRLQGCALEEVAPLARSARNALRAWCATERLFGIQSIEREKAMQQEELLNEMVRQGTLCEELGYHAHLPAALILQTRVAQKAVDAAAALGFSIGEEVVPSASM